MFGNRIAKALTINAALFLGNASENNTLRGATAPTPIVDLTNDAKPSGTIGTAESFKGALEDYKFAQNIISIDKINIELKGEVGPKEKAADEKEIKRWEDDSRTAVKFMKLNILASSPTERTKIAKVLADEIEQLQSDLAVTQERMEAANKAEPKVAHPDLQDKLKGLEKFIKVLEEVSDVLKAPSPSASTKPAFKQA